MNTTGTTITGLEASTTYTFAVTARDAAGNESAASTIQVTTEVILSVAEAPLRDKLLRVYPKSFYGRNCAIRKIQACKPGANSAGGWHGLYQKPDPGGWCLESSGVGSACRYVCDLY